MNSREWLRNIESAENCQEGYGFSLRGDFANIIVKYLHEKHMTQAQLAHAAGMKPQQLSRIIHSSANSTLDTVGRVLFALRAKMPKLTVQGGSLAFETECGEAEFAGAGKAVISEKPNARSRNGKHSKR